MHVFKQEPQPIVAPRCPRWRCPCRRKDGGRTGGRAPMQALMKVVMVQAHRDGW